MDTLKPMTIFYSYKFPNFFFFFFFLHSSIYLFISFLHLLFPSVSPPHPSTQMNTRLTIQLFVPTHLPRRISKFEPNFILYLSIIDIDPRSPTYWPLLVRVDWWATYALIISSLRPMSHSSCTCATTSSLKHASHGSNSKSFISFEKVVVPLNAKKKHITVCSFLFFSLPNLQEIFWANNCTSLQMGRKKVEKGF